MGGTQSKDPVVIPARNEASIKFSPAVLSQLSDNLHSTTTSPDREDALDKHVRERIHAELVKLQEEEADVKQALRTALEKENLVRERTIAGDSNKEDGSDSTNAGSRGTASLSEDIEAVKRRVEKYAQRKQLGAGTAVEESRQSVVNCYKEHPDKPLNCWREVEEFKKQVASVEARFVDSLK